MLLCDICTQTDTNQNSHHIKADKLLVVPCMSRFESVEIVLVSIAVGVLFSIDKTGTDALEKRSLLIMQNLENISEVFH